MTNLLESRLDLGCRKVERKLAGREGGLRESDSHLWVEARVSWERYTGRGEDEGRCCEGLSQRTERSRVNFRKKEKRSFSQQGKNNIVFYIISVQFSSVQFQISETEAEPDHFDLVWFFNFGSVFFHLFQFRFGFQSRFFSFRFFELNPSFHAMCSIGRSVSFVICNKKLFLEC